MTLLYSSEDSTGMYLLEDGSGFYQLEGVSVVTGMPILIGLDYYAAELVLLQAGIFVKPGYFQASTISVQFSDTGAAFAFGMGAFGIAAFGGPTAPGFVIAQSPAPAADIALGSAIALTLGEFAMSVAFP
jgi:hypothetical protein